MRKKLGPGLPAIDDPAPPDDEEITRHIATWNRLVPEYAGMLEPKAPGTADAKYWYDDARGVMLIAKSGKIVTMSMKRKAMILFQKRLKSG